MEQFINTITAIQDEKTLILLCALFIFADVLTGYAKAFKFKEVNSSISRDGYIKKMAWAIAILVGLCFKILTGLGIFLFISAFVCIATEGMSLYENLGELGIDLPFTKYFEKLKESIEEVENDGNSK